jgi:serine/threonine protein kinase
MGEVYKVSPVGGKRVFALKRLPTEALKDTMLSTMFIDEGRIAASVVGRNLVRLIEHGDADGEHYLLFEWIDGVTLEALLAELARRGSMLPIDQTTRLFAQIADALDRLHASVDGDGIPTQMVHRDLSPSNILIDFDGHPHIVDFGLSKSRMQLTTTQPGFVKGKFGYLAPEQLEGLADHRTDLFAFGICLYETLTGARLFDRPTVDASVQALRRFGGVQSTRPLRADVPENLDTVVCKLLAAKPDDRIQTASDARREILGAIPAVHLSGHSLSEATGALLAHFFPTRVPKRATRADTAREATPSSAPTERRGRSVSLAGVFLLLLAIAAVVFGGGLPYVQQWLAKYF